MEYTTDSRRWRTLFVASLTGIEWVSAAIVMFWVGSLSVRSVELAALVRRSTDVSVSFAGGSAEPGSTRAAADSAEARRSVTFRVVGQEAFLTWAAQYPGLGLRLESETSVSLHGEIAEPSDIVDLLAALESLPVWWQAESWSISRSGGRILVSLTISFGGPGGAA